MQVGGSETSGLHDAILFPLQTTKSVTHGMSISCNLKGIFVPFILNTVVYAMCLTPKILSKIELFCISTKNVLYHCATLKCIFNRLHIGLLLHCITARAQQNSKKELHIYYCRYAITFAVGLTN